MAKGSRKNAASSSPTLSNVLWLGSRPLSVGRASETVSKLGQRQKKWYGEGGYCPWSPYPTLSQRKRLGNSGRLQGPSPRGRALG